MKPASYFRWLKARDARAIARVERTVYPPSARDGLSEIRFDLERAQELGSNLSLGLFAGTSLVGYFLAYIQPDRRAAFEEFEVECDNSWGLQGAAIYVQDIVMRPGHVPQGRRLILAWAREVRRRYPDLPMDAFCRPAALELWRRHSKLLAALGFEFEAERAVRDLAGQEAWYWLSWRARPASAFSRPPPVRSGSRLGTRLDTSGLPPGWEARLVTTEMQWRQIEPAWDRIVDALPQAGPFQSCVLQRCWWRHFGLQQNLHIVVLYREGEVAGIAPMMVAPERHAGLHYDSLQFVGDSSLTERPEVIVDPSVEGARALLWRAVAATHEHWNAALLEEQGDSATTHPLPSALRNGAVLVRETPAQIAPWVALGGGWPAYLAGRSRALRKGLARKRRKLENAGKLELHLAHGAMDGEAQLARYLAVDACSWKHAAGYGVGSRTGRADYYRELCATLGPAGGLRFAFLALDGRDIAASVSLVRRGRIAALEVCHDQAFDRYSPGFVLTGLELEALFKEEGLVEFDFLSGTLENKLPWATGQRETRDLYLLPCDARGRLALAWMFDVKPAAKRGLDALGIREPFMAAVERARARLGWAESP